MNLNVLTIALALLLLVVSFILLLFFNCNTILRFFSINLKPVFRRQVDKNLIGHRQKWRCAKCNTVMLSNFRIVTVQNLDYAICLTCSKGYNCTDKECLV
jgi:hypothetical protein